MTHSKRTTRSTSGFTLAELLVGIFVVFLLMGLSLVAFKSASGGARKVSDRALINGLKIAVQEFSSEFGMVPPLVKDFGSDASNPYPIVQVDGLAIPAVYSTAIARDLVVLRDGNDIPGRRYSTYSLAYYLVGALDAAVDGVDGPGFVEVRRAGNFATATDKVKGRAGDVEIARRGPKRFEPFFDTDSGSVDLYIDTTNRMTLTGSGGGLTRTRLVYRTEIHDRRGTPVRYYRWLKDDVDISGLPGGLAGYTDHSYEFDQQMSGLIAYLNVPLLVLYAYGDPLSPEYEVPLDVRAASYAIVSAGPNKLFGDPGDENRLQAETELQKQYAENLGLSVTRFATDSEYRLKAVEMAREDNIVEVGS